MTKPLPLNSPIWSELDHAYGKAEDIPELLRELAEKSGFDDPNCEPMFTLWSSLCHQGDVYSASFAAFPHLVDIASNKAPSDMGHILMLAAAIAGAVDDPAQFLMSETGRPYLESKQAALNMMSELFVTQPCPEIQYWLGSLAALKGRTAFARAMFSFDGIIDASLEAKAEFPIEDALLRELRG